MNILFFLVKFAHSEDSRRRTRDIFYHYSFLWNNFTTSASNIRDRYNILPDKGKMFFIPVMHPAVKWLSIISRNVPVFYNEPVIYTQ